MGRLISGHKVKAISIEICKKDGLLYIVADHPWGRTVNLLIRGKLADSCLYIEGNSPVCFMDILEFQDCVDAVA